MDTRELLRTLDSMLASAPGRMSFVVTDVPQSLSRLEALLDGAIAAARRHRIPLAEVQLDMASFPEIGPFYWHVPVVDTARSGVMRLVFEPVTLAEPAAAAVVGAHATA
jgi:hypothetical protein